MRWGWQGVGERGDQAQLRGPQGGVAEGLVHTSGGLTGLFSL